MTKANVAIAGIGVAWRIAAAIQLKRYGAEFLLFEWKERATFLETPSPSQVAHKYFTHRVQECKPDTLTL